MNNKFENLKKVNIQNKNQIERSIDKLSHETIENYFISKERVEKADYITKNVNIILSDLDKNFEEVTKLKKIDISFLFLAVSLQVARQILISSNFDKDERPTDKESAEKNKKLEKMIFGTDEIDRSLRGNSPYVTTLDEIIKNPVPFDTQNGAPFHNVNLGGGKNHRIYTAGHDPILGLIFGTANISTRTMTTMPTFQSFHIEYGQFTTGVGVVSKIKGDALKSPAMTSKVLKYGMYDRLVKPKDDDLLIFLVSLAKEMLHLASDWNSKESLALPFMSIKPSIAMKLNSLGIDMDTVGNVTSQATLSIIINKLIFWAHQLLINSIEIEGSNLSLLQIRSQKIITYSNTIASTLNLVHVAKTKKINHLDIGGLVVTVYQLMTNKDFQKKQKEIFLEKEFYKIIDDI